MVVLYVRRWLVELGRSLVDFIKSDIPVKTKTDPGRLARRSIKCIKFHETSSDNLVLDSHHIE